MKRLSVLWALCGLLSCASAGAGSTPGDDLGADAAGGDTDDPVFVSPSNDVGAGVGDLDAAGADAQDDTSGEGSPDARGERPCTRDEDCGDENPCVVSVCGVSGRCVATPLAGKPCDDQDVCTTGEACDATGACSGGASLLDDAAPCEVCTCDPVTGLSCEPAAYGDPCDDGDCCSLNDRCAACEPGSPGCSDAGRVCRGAAKACVDSDPCTLDSCTCDAEDEPVCGAAPAPDGTACEADAKLCTAGDLCAAGVCVAGEALPLDDGDPCTQDVCVKGQVVHQPLNAGQCDDGNQCTTGDHCLLGTCVGGPAVTCVVPECAGSSSCVAGQGCVPSWLPEGAACPGEALCASAFACTAGHQCAALGPKSCDDGNLCTADTCDPATGACAHTPIDLQCADTPCVDPVCNPATGGCDLPAPDGTACPGGLCEDGVCTCQPACAGDCGDDGCGGSCGACEGGDVCVDGVCTCQPTCVGDCGDDGCGGSCGACEGGDACVDGVCTCQPACTGDCGDDGCGGSCGTCGPGATCTQGVCVDSCAACPGKCLPDGTCCPADGFCPTTDTTLSGTHSYSRVYIPVGVKVTCTGAAPLVLNVSGAVTIDGTLSADGAAGSAVSDSAQTPGACGGAAGGDGFRDCTSSATTYCEAGSAATCQALISAKESWSGNACTYVAFAPGQPGEGPGGGYGGQMAHPLHNSAPGTPAGGGGGSYVAAGGKGAGGQTNCGALSGGAAGPAVASNLLKGGSGGGAGGVARNNACGTSCPAGCTAWGGDGGAGGGVIHVIAGGVVEVNGLISARGGAGGAGGGATCTGAGGGGSGGVVRVVAPSLVVPGNSTHLDVSGGSGGVGKCGAGAGQGGAGGAGVLALP